MRPLYGILAAAHAYLEARKEGKSLSEAELKQVMREAKAKAKRERPATSIQQATADFEEIQTKAQLYEAVQQEAAELAERERSARQSAYEAEFKHLEVSEQRDEAQKDNEVLRTENERLRLEREQLEHRSGVDLKREYPRIGICGAAVRKYVKLPPDVGLKARQLFGMFEHAPGFARQRARCTFKCKLRDGVIRPRIRAQRRLPSLRLFCREQAVDSSHRNARQSASG